MKVCGASCVVLVLSNNQDVYLNKRRPVGLVHADALDVLGDDS